MKRKDRERIRAIANAASPSTCWPSARDLIPRFAIEADRDHIAAAHPEAVIELLDEIDRLEARLRESRSDYAELRTANDRLEAEIVELTEALGRREVDDFERKERS